MKRSSVVTFSILGIFLFSACATQLSKSGAHVRDATMAMVEHCEYVGNFVATDMGGFDQAQRLSNVKLKVRNQAGEAGANRVVWGVPSRGGTFGNEPIIVGDGYRCPE
ncbi:MAG: hypothetical protein HQK87_01720 [Nitrospinae bacterium]|nr:hypothetical protein [Nitrospinota bacterium]